MEARMKNPAMIFPEAMQGMFALNAVVEKAGLPSKTVGLVHLRVSQINGCPDPRPDEIWEEATRHYDERALAGLLLAISLINVWNRLNVSTKQVAGEWMKSNPQITQKASV